jgi:outer membrane protein assembly factor BamB
LSKLLPRRLSNRNDVLLSKKNSLTAGAALAAIVLAFAWPAELKSAVQGQGHSSPAAPTPTAAGPLTPLAEDILSAAGTGTGLCIVAGCESGELAAEIVRRSNFFVHTLVHDEAKLDSVRRTLEATGAYGLRAAAERGSLSRLPYPDYCANLIVCDLPVLPQDAACWAEVVRVLRPGGLACVGQSADTSRNTTKISASALREGLSGSGVVDFEIVETHGVWARVRRARPDGMGDWSHGRWGTAGNNPCVEDALVKAPFHTAWIAGPKSFTKFGLPLASNGRVLLRHGGITNEGRYTPPREPDLIQAFDAYNGAILWERRLEEREGDGFVAVGDRVLAASTQTLYALNAVDGTVAWKLPAEKALAGMKSWGQYLLADGVVVAALSDSPPQDGFSIRQKALLGLSPVDGSLKWKLQPEDGIRSFALGERRCFYSTRGDLAAVRLATGQEVWRRVALGSSAVRYHRGIAYTDSASFAAADGKPGAKGNFRGLFVGDHLYLGGLKGVTVTDAATGAATRPLPVPRDPYCPKTGIPDGCSFMYGRCIMPTASTNCYFFSYGGTVIGDLLRNELFPCEGFRSNCRTGVIAGNGLVYNSPSGCACSFAVRSGISLVPVDEAFYWGRPKSKPPPQLEKGPAFPDEIAAGEPPDAWPCFRHDAARSSVTDARVAWPMETEWQVSLPGRLTPPVAADGSVFIGSDNHSAYSLDAATGTVRWRFITGGEVLASPAWWQGRLYVGSQDGWVYCLRADSGKLVWRFRGAPHERNMLVHGRPQSLWPIAGGVIVEDGKVQFCAGRLSHDRVFVWSLDARTGEVLWQNDKAGRAVEVIGSAGGISPHGVSPSGVLAASKGVLYVPQGMFAPAAFARSDGRLLWWGRRGDSTQRSNIEVQNLGGPDLAVGEGLLFVGGADPVYGSSHAFVALDARSGRMWGADDPRLLAKAGRDETGRAVDVKKAVFGTKPIRFGSDSAPVVVDGGIFCRGYRGSFLDLKRHLDTQFGAPPGDARRWSTALPPGPLIVAGDKVLIASASRLVALARSDGKSMGEVGLTIKGIPLSDGLAAAEGKVFVVTTAGEVNCLCGAANGGKWRPFGKWSMR